MMWFSYIGNKLKQLCRSCLFGLRWVHLRGNSFSLELFYFLFISFLGFVFLLSFDTRSSPNFTPTNLDLFFTSVSAVTLSSMSIIEMEVFSNTQLAILTILMFIGGEVFTSMVSYHIRMIFFENHNSPKEDRNKVDPSACYQAKQGTFLVKIELSDLSNLELGGNSKFESATEVYLMEKSYKFLGAVIMFYLVFVHFMGIVSVLIYLHVIPNAINIVKHKGLESLTFSIFTVVSTFANCGFVPTNENMIIFRQNSGLLLILIPQVLLGNTLYPPALRFSIWAIGKFIKKSESRYLLENNSNVHGYEHLRSYLPSCSLLVTVLVFILLQAILFSTMEWSSESLRGMNAYQKLVGIVFQIVNARHSGESIVDLSTISGAVLVMFVVMMYLPPYTSFVPVSNRCCEQGSKRNNRNTMENLIFSQLTYLVIFIILVCITERKHLVKDPLNFSVLNIVVEVISAYGNVGFSTGYSCDRRLKLDDDCVNKWYGFSGKWSDEGKLILIVVMIFGRLKKYNINAGKAWQLL